MRYTFEQKSKIVTQGEQRLINIKKKFFDDLKEKKLLGRDLNITITLDDNVDVS